MSQAQWTKEKWPKVWLEKLTEVIMLDPQQNIWIFFFSNYFRRPLKVFNLEKNGCLMGNGMWANSQITVVVQVGNDASLAHCAGRGDEKMWTDSRLYDGRHEEGRKLGHQGCSQVSDWYSWVDGGDTKYSGID